MKKDVRYDNSEDAYKSLFNSVSLAYSLKKRKLNKENKKNSKIAIKMRKENKKKCPKNRKQSKRMEEREEKERQKNMQKVALKYTKEIFFKHYDELINNSLKSFLECLKSYNSSEGTASLDDYSYYFEISYTVCDDDVKMFSCEDCRNNFKQYMLAIIRYVLKRNMNIDININIYIPFFDYEYMHCFGKEKRVKGSIVFRVVESNGNLEAKCDKDINEVAKLYMNMYKDEEKKNKELFNIAFKEYEEKIKETRRIQKQKATDFAVEMLSKYHDVLIDKALSYFLKSFEELEDLPYMYTYVMEDSEMKSEISNAVSELKRYDLISIYEITFKKTLMRLIQSELSNNFPFKIKVYIKSSRYNYGDKDMFFNLYYYLDYRKNVILKELSNF